MKTKFNYLTLAVIALSLGFIGCSNNEDPGDTENKENKSVFLKISGGEATTHSEGDPAIDNSDVGFSSGDLYFTSTAGVILAHYFLTGADTDLAAGNIKLSEIKTGRAVPNIPGQVTTVYVVGNTSGLPITGNISSVKGTLKSITTQGTLASVNLYGTNTLMHTSGTNYTCAITLKPTVARIELTNIKSSGTVITGFTVSGIFIDNYYSQAAVDGTVNGGDLENNGSDATLFNTGSSAYDAPLSGYVFDFYPSGRAATALTVTPTDAADVWGYNLFGNVGSGSFAIPRIIIRISSITTSDGSSYTYPQFITIKGFKEGATSLTSIDAGKIYNIGAGALTFNEKDLAPAPNMDAINATVTVTLAKWEVVEVTPEL